MTDRTIFIGDLHGMADETEELLRLLQLTPTDHVIFLGDYVDRGPDSARCCDIARRREQLQGAPAGILGNHEDTHLRYQELHRIGALDLTRIPPSHAATRTQLQPEHYDWLRALPLYVRVPQHNAVAVHAGAFPGRSIEKQKRQHLLHVQMLRPYDFVADMGLVINERSVWPSRVPKDEDGWRFWTHFWDGDETVVFGHSVLTQPLVTDKFVGIDGGAVFGYQLHAYVLPEKRIVSVQSKREFRRGKRGPGEVRVFKVHGEVGTYS
jgi:hypothetical protein